MTYCRVCGESTSVYVCGRCVEAWRALLRKAVLLDTEMECEVARLSVKGKAGGASGGSPEAVALGALEARIKLSDSLGKVYAQVGVKEPETAERQLHVVQESPRDVDALYDDFAAMLDAVEVCTAMVDVRETITTVGSCECGAPVAAYPSQSFATCRVCGAREPVHVYSDRRRRSALTRVSGHKLTREQANDYIAAGLPGCKKDTVKKWFTRRHIKSGPDGLYDADEIQAFIQTRVSRYSTHLD